MAKAAQSVSASSTANKANGELLKTIRDRFIERLKQMQWRSLISATRNDLYMALAYSVRDLLLSLIHI